MNWMTSAKNRFQRSNKSKNNNNLRMTASSKLPAPRSRSNVVMHNMQQIPVRSTAGGIATRVQSNDVWMLNNHSREHNKSSESAATLQKDTVAKNPELQRPMISGDPLRQLEVTPPKRWCEDAEELIEEQQIIYFNDGQLCNELGHLLIDVSSNQASPGLTVAPTRRLFSPVSERTPPQTSVGALRDSPEMKLDSAEDENWWHRLLIMLDSGGMSPTHLHTVLEEIATTIGSGSRSSIEQLAEMDQPPTTRDALNALYRALSKVGRDTRASLTVFDAIRMLELADKQHSDRTVSYTGGAGGTASTIRTNNTASSHLPLHAYSDLNSANANPTALLYDRNTNVSVGRDDSEWNLFDAPISASVTTGIHMPQCNNNTSTNSATVICAKRKLSPANTTGSGSHKESMHTHAINAGTNASAHNGSTNGSGMYSCSNSSASYADMELKLEDLF